MTLADFALLVSTIFSNRQFSFATVENEYVAKSNDYTVHYEQDYRMYTVYNTSNNFFCTYSKLSDYRRYPV